MTLWIGLHGNPGRGSDLGPLLAPLRDGADAVELPSAPVPAASLDLLLAEIAQRQEEHGEEATVLVGYSWGAWLALHAATRCRRLVGLVLISPSIVVERPLSPLAPLVLRLPLLGRSILRRLAVAAPQYLEREFAPLPVPEAVSRERLPWLSQPEVWLAAAQYKVLQQRRPAPVQPPAPAPVLVVAGACDAVIDLERQREALAPWRQGETVVEELVPQAGHGLPWTHTAVLRERILGWVEQARGEGASAYGSER